MNDYVQKIFAEESYRTYRDSRDKAPNIAPKCWRHVFGNEVFEFEARYQAEKATQKAKS